MINKSRQPEYEIKIKEMNTKKIAGSVIIAVIGGLIAVFAYTLLIDNPSETVIVREQPAVNYANLPTFPQTEAVDFTYAAENSVHAVVHVKTKATRESAYNPFYEFFFGDSYREPQPVMGYGSGVIISEDGYIVTNNHVIENSDEIEVVLNDKNIFDAEIIGTDPSTDLAVLKIKAGYELPFLKWGNSDDLMIGEWVLAVGNPYNLTSTVTAGIVSAKARPIGINRRNLAVESFIQTDAAVNPGNSGGALVDLKGKLVGINAAIASRTGAFSGYSFAIPVSIVEKVTADIIEYGTVQRAILGVTIQEVTADIAKEHNIEDIRGVYISDLREGGAAQEAGLKKGDVILAINDVPVNSPSELQEQISRHRPGDEVEVRFSRNNKVKQMDVVLRNLRGDTGIVKQDQMVDMLGASFREVSDALKQKLNIKGGVQVSEVESKGKFKSAGIKEGFIILRINNQEVSSVDDIRDIIASINQGGVYIQGVYPDGYVAYYAFGI